jgi:hypothetical protein
MSSLPSLGTFGLLRLYGCATDFVAGARSRGNSVIVVEVGCGNKEKTLHKMLHVKAPRSCNLENSGATFNNTELHYSRER